MKKGSYIYYFGKGGSIPAIVQQVNKKTLTIKGDFHEAPKIRRVSINNCQLQSDWAKENGI